jgi:hypothetical protein
MFQGGRLGGFVKMELHLPIVIEKGGEIDNEVPNEWKVRERFDEDRFFQQTFDLSSAGQDHAAVDSHGA